MVDAIQLDALRTLINPEVIAAWLDEVESHRGWPVAPAPPHPILVHSEPPAHERLLTVRDVSERLGLSRGVIYRVVQENQLPYVRLGHRIRFVWSRVQERLEDPCWCSAEPTGD